MLLNFYRRFKEIFVIAHPAREAFRDFLRIPIRPDHNFHQYRSVIARASPSPVSSLVPPSTIKMNFLNSDVEAVTIYKI